MSQRFLKRGCNPASGSRTGWAACRRACWWMSAEHRTGKGEEVLASTVGANPCPGVRRGAQHPLGGRCRGSKGRSPLASPAVIPWVSWLTNISRVRPALGRGVRDTATAAVAAVSGHLRERSGGAVQADLAKRGWRSDEGRRCLAVHGTPESRAANDLASAHVAGHWHWFRLGVDQPDSLRLLRVFDSFARAVPQASVTRGAASYELHPPWVSIQPLETKAAEADPRHLANRRGWDRPQGPDRRLRHECRAGRCGGVYLGCADPRVELVFPRLHPWMLKDCSRGSQPVGNVLLCQDVSGRVRTCPPGGRGCQRLMVREGGNIVVRPNVFARMDSGGYPSRSGVQLVHVEHSRAPR